MGLGDNASTIRDIGGHTQIKREREKEKNDFFYVFWGAHALPIDNVTAAGT